MIGNLGTISFTWDFFLAFLSIILINLVLSGDNAVVIALAVRTLPHKQRLRGIAIGAGVAIILRVFLTFVAAKLLMIKFVQFLGGALIAWIAVKLFMEGVPEEESKREAKTLVQAVVTILIADITMSTDNVLAVAGASQGNFFLLLFGLALSIPIVVFASDILSRLMDRYPIIVYIGAAILGQLAGEMIIMDPFIYNALHPASWVEWIVRAFFAGGVIVVGKIWMKMRAAKEVPAPASVEPYGK